MKEERILILVITLSTIAYMGNWFGIRDLLLKPAPVVLPQIGEKLRRTHTFQKMSEICRLEKYMQRHLEISYIMVLCRTEQRQNCRLMNAPNLW